MSDKIGIGLIGCGGFSRYHIRNLMSVGDAEVVAMCDPDPMQIERCLTDFPHLEGLPRYSDHESLLADPRVHAVEIATPHSFHKAQVLDSFAAGKHVMCEKPLALSVRDAHEMMDAQQRSGKVGLIGYQRHQKPEFQRIRSEIASGKFGAVTFVSALLTQEWKRFTEGTWRQDPVLSGGGQLNDSGSHLVDILLWATGLKAKSVSCFLDHRGTAVDIDSVVNIQFEGGAIGNLSIVGDAPMWHEDVAIWCQKGAFFLRSDKLMIVEADGAKFYCENLQSPSQNPDAHFVACIRGWEQPLAPFECGLRVIELTEAAWKSADMGGAPVSVGDLGKA